MSQVWFVIIRFLHESGHLVSKYTPGWWKLVAIFYFPISWVAVLIPIDSYFSGRGGPGEGMIDA